MGIASDAVGRGERWISLLIGWEYGRSTPISMPKSLLPITISLCTVLRIFSVVRPSLSLAIVSMFAISANLGHAVIHGIYAWAQHLIMLLKEGRMGGNDPQSFFQMDEYCLIKKHRVTICF